MTPQPEDWELVAAPGRAGRNTGLVRASWDRRAPAAAPRTVVVLGAFRGGTSMAAAVLARLGVPMGPGRDEVVFEDPEFNRLLAGRRLALRRLRALIAERDRASSLWGWKYPGTVRHLGRVCREIRAPHLVVVLRDPLAIAAREHLATGAALGAALASGSRQLRDVVRAAISTPYPMLLASHDKALRAPGDFVDEVCRLVRLEPGSAVRAAAVAAVSPEPRAYLDHARRHSCRGHLDGVSEGVVWGWACDASRGEPLAVEVHLDGRRLGVVTADLARPDLRAAGLGEGEHGFRLALAGPLLDGRRHEIRAIAVEPDWELPGSPLVAELNPRAVDAAP